jgi:hypothetical protein
MYSTLLTRNDEPFVSLPPAGIVQPAPAVIVAGLAGNGPHTAPIQKSVLLEAEKAPDAGVVLVPEALAPTPSVELDVAAPLTSVT